MESQNNKNVVDLSLRPISPAQKGLTDEFLKSLDVIQ